MNTSNVTEPIKPTNRYDFADAVIKAPWLSRLTDRTFLPPLLFVCLVWIAALNGKTDFDRAIDFTKWVLLAFIGAEKGKDALVGYGAASGGSMPVASLDVAAAPVAFLPPAEAQGHGDAENDLGGDFDADNAG